MEWVAPNSFHRNIKEKQKTTTTTTIKQTTYVLWKPRRKREKGAENVFEDNIANNLPNFMKYMNLHIQAAE